MTQNYLKQLMTALLLLCCTVAGAADFEVDGIYYNILSSEDKTVEVTSGSNKYSGAVTIPASVTYNSITYSVTSIGNGAFEGCHDLTSIEIPSSVTSIGNDAFFYCTGLTSIEIPSSVTSIGKWAFSSCVSLTSIEIPSSVTSIGERAFEDCWNLASIVVDEGNTIYDSRGNCNAIIETASNTLIAGCKNTIIPEGVTSIGNNAFYYCTGLTSIEIPSSVTSIGISVFSGCSGLKRIISYIPADKLFTPGDYAFQSVNNEACTLYVPAGAKSTYAATDGWNAFENIVEFNGMCGDNLYWSLNEETGVLTIFGEGEMYNYADNDANRVPWYSNKENITSVTIEEGVTSIGNSAFADCTGLTSIEIPSSVTSIGESAFNYCPGLTSIEISSSVTSIGDYAFEYCDLTSIEIPSSVTSIGESAFGSCSGLTSIEIPSSVTSIGERAFRGCTGLTSIVVDEGNTIYDSRGNCHAIIETASNTLIAGFKNTIIPEGVTSIGNSAFYHCYGLTSIEIPSSVTSIGESAFFYCKGLTSIEIPSSVTSIGYYAFAHCTVLTSIEIPSSVTSIGNYTFYHCDGLTSIEIPSSVTSIGGSAFAYCTGLTSIGIPSSVTSIGAWAFSGCTSLTSVVSCIAAEDLFAINTVAFSGIDNEACTLYVPAGAKSTYAATDGWSNFTNIVEMSTEEYSLTVSSAGYATMYLDKAVKIPAGAKAYTANRVEGDYLKMQPVEGVIPANTAVIIKAEEGTYSFAYSDETPEAISDNLLRGTVADTYVKPQSGSVAYVLSMVDGVVGMYRAKLTDGTFKNNANRAYMLLSELNVGDGNLDTSAPGSQLSNGYRFDFSGTTAIESIESEQDEAVYYDLSGRRVENPVSGIYIINGKKVLVK